ncbi:hypothetical protein OH710_19890 [Pseudomonas capsici]|uniref:hypothetical protein n=1 Tax=Pseudomonas capsici TaxID=2810614 RepID=UPI0021F1CC07|nr:hypothetical protein [Pseudomonas capsici]MCV4274908.1 hypothetical protein [Pseudomonas capsici]
MAYVVHGATGAQGAPLKNRLLVTGHDVIGSGGEGSLRLDSVESLTASYRGADGVFVHLPMGSEASRLRFAENIVAAVKAGKPKRVVISTSGTIVDEPGTPLQTPDDSALALLLRGIADSGVSHAVVATRLYLENLLLPMVLEPAKSEGVLRYALRADYPVSWSSHLDVAEVAERLLTDHGVTGVVGVGQLPGLVGADLAAAFATHLGGPVSFEAATPEDFGDLLRPMFGPAADPVVELYRALAQAKANVIDERTSAQRLLGLKPRTVDQWLAEISQ